MANENPNSAIIKYIRETRSSGFTDDQIKESLKSAGWDDAEVNASFDTLANQASPSTNTATSPQNPSNVSPAVSPISNSPTTQPSQQSSVQPIQPIEPLASQPAATSAEPAPTTNGAKLRNLLEEEQISPVQTANIPLDQNQASNSNRESLLEFDDSGNLDSIQSNQSNLPPDQQNTSPAASINQLDSNPLQSEPLPEMQGVTQKPQRKWLMPALVGVGVLGVFVLGTFAFSMLRSNPATTIENAFANWAQSESFSYSGRVSMSLPQETAEAIVGFSTAGSDRHRIQLAQLNQAILNDGVALAQTTNEGMVINFSGNSDLTDPNNAKKTIMLDIVESANLPFNLGLELTIIDGQVYMQIRNVDAPSEINIDTIISQPILVDLAKLGEILEQPQLITEAQKITGSGRITPANVREIAQKYTMFTDLTTLPGERINNQDTNRFGFRGTDQFGVAVEELLGSGTLPVEIIAVLRNLNSVAGEVWIGQNNNMPLRLMISGLNGTDNFRLELNFSSFNQVPTIIAPTNSKPLGLAIFQLFDQVAQSGIELPGVSPLLFEDTDNDGLYDVLEPLFGAVVGNPDTDNDGFLDGEEVRNGYNPAGPGRLEF